MNEQEKKDEFGGDGLVSYGAWRSVTYGTDQEKKWEEEEKEKFEKILPELIKRSGLLHPLKEYANPERIMEGAMRLAWFERAKQRQEEMEKEIRRYRLVIRKLTLGLDEFWINSPEGKAVKDEVQKLFKEAK